MKRNFLNRFSKNAQISSFMNIRLVGADLFHVDRETERHDKLTVAFHSSVTAPKNNPQFSRTFCKVLQASCRSVASDHMIPAPRHTLRPAKMNQSQNNVKNA